MPIKFRSPVCGYYQNGSCAKKKPVLLFFGTSCHFVYGYGCIDHVNKLKELVESVPPPPPPPPPKKPIVVELKTTGIAQYDLNDIVERLDKIVKLLESIDIRGKPTMLGQVKPVSS